MAGLSTRSTPLFVGPVSVRNRVRPPVHPVGFSTLRPGCPGLLQRRLVESSEMQHTSVYEDGYLVLHNFFTEAELPGLGNSDNVQSSVLEGSRGQLLRNLVGELVKVELGKVHVQEPGFKCTDGATSPEPWWDSTWEVEKLDVDDQQRLDSASETARLVVSSSGRTTKICGGRFCVYPRSHWLVADWSWAISGGTSDIPPLKAFQAPAATVIELELGCGDAVVLHPGLAWSLAPNISKSSTTFLFLKLFIEQPTYQRLSGTKAAQIWHGWTALTNQFKRGLTNFHSEEVELMAEEVKAVEGGWATVSHEGIMSVLQFSCTYVAPRDHLSWQLSSCVNEFMRVQKWEQAMVMLLRLAGLRPRSYWVAYNAGRCCVLSAPRGQLAGRAGRKSRLEDAERFLLRAIEMAPGWPLAYQELAETLLFLGHGREKGIPEILQTMNRRCNIQHLCSKYPEVSGDLKLCEKRCEGILSDLSS